MILIFLQLVQLVWSCSPNRIPHPECDSFSLIWPATREYPQTDWLDQQQCLREYLGQQATVCSFSLLGVVSYCWHILNYHGDDLAIVFSSKEYDCTMYHTGIIETEQSSFMYWPIGATCSNTSPPSSVSGENPAPFSLMFMPRGHKYIIHTRYIQYIPSNQKVRGRSSRSKRNSKLVQYSFLRRSQDSWIASSATSVPAVWHTTIVSVKYILYLYLYNKAPKWVPRLQWF